MSRLFFGLEVSSRSRVGTSFFDFPSQSLQLVYHPTWLLVLENMIIGTRNYIRVPIITLGDKRVDFQLSLSWSRQSSITYPGLSSYMSWYTPLSDSPVLAWPWGSEEFLPFIWIRHPPDPCNTTTPNHTIPLSSYLPNGSRTSRSPKRIRMFITVVKVALWSYRPYENIEDLILVTIPR